MAHALDLNFEDTEIAFRSKSTAELRKAQLLFRTLGQPTLATAGPKLMNVALALRLPVTPLIKWTVFDQFCGGETLQESLARVGELARFGIRSVLDYSVEGLGKEADFERTTAEIERVIAVARDNEAMSFAVFKVTGIARFDLLERVSRGAPLTADESAEWARVDERFHRLCRAASKAGIRILVDAEESWIQPAIDRLVFAAMRALNRQRAVVYNTLQMYLENGLPRLGELLDAAKNGGFMAGVKLVRGAYMEKERAHAAAAKLASPVQRDKVATDTAFDQAVATTLNCLQYAALFAGTHNDQSTLRLAERLVEQGIERNDPRVEFSQLLGMSDHLTYNLAHHGFNVSKYVPYGPVRAVMPYLTRRAAENSSIQGQTGRELSLIERELRRRATRAYRGNVISGSSASR